MYPPSAYIEIKPADITIVYVYQERVLQYRTCSPVQNVFSPSVSTRSSQQISVPHASRASAFSRLESMRASPLYLSEQNPLASALVK